MNENINNLLNETLVTILEWKLGHATTSSTVPDIPASDIFVSTEANNSVIDVCLIFWAIAPIAWAAATLVSQFLLRRYWETCFTKYRDPSEQKVLQTEVKAYGIKIEINDQLLFNENWEWWITFLTRVMTICSSLRLQWRF